MLRVQLRATRLKKGPPPTLWRSIDIAEKIREAVQNKKFKFNDVNYGTTISMGVAEFSGEHEKETLIEKSDQALYKAKNEGKNRVVLYQ